MGEPRLAIEEVRDEVVGCYWRKDSRMVRKVFFMPPAEDSRAYDVAVVPVTGWFPEGSKGEGGSKDQQEGVSRRLSKYNTIYKP